MWLTKDYRVRNDVKVQCVTLGKWEGYLSRSEERKSADLEDNLAALGDVAAMSVLKGMCTGTDGLVTWVIIGKC